MLPEQPLVLRAEVLYRGKQVLAHTARISEMGGVLQTDEPMSVGERLLVRLSFPHLVAPLELEAHVVSKRLASGPGAQAQVTLAFVFRSDAEHGRLRDLLDRGHDASPITDEERVYRVLLVEDSEVLRDMFLFAIRKHLNPRDTRVVVDVAEDGESAWAMLAGGGYRLAIVDFYLPLLNGSSLVERVRREPALTSLSIVAMSVGGSTAREAFLAAGADIYIDKPLVIRDFLCTLDRLTNGWEAA